MHHKIPAVALLGAIIATEATAFSHEKLGEAGKLTLKVGGKFLCQQLEKLEEQEENDEDVEDALKEIEDKIEAAGIDCDEE